MGDTTETENPTSAPAPAPEKFDSLLEFLEIILKLSQKKPSELARTKTGRQTLRALVADSQKLYKLALAACHNDPVYLNHVLHQRWGYQMSYIFRSRSPHSLSRKASKHREKITATLPKKDLVTKSSGYPSDPYVVDKEFFEQVFNLRASLSSFKTDDNLTLVYNKYKEMWMDRYASGYHPFVFGAPGPLLSEVVYLWLEVNFERAVCIVTEWEMHGITSDEEDIWLNDIPSDVVPVKVLNLIDDDTLYLLRMSEHDRSRNSRLFYGLPVGTRLPTLFPTEEINLRQAEQELSEAAAKLDTFHGEQGMGQLGRAANQYLRVWAMNK